MLVRPRFSSATLVLLGAAAIACGGSTSPAVDGGAPSDTFDGSSQNQPPFEAGAEVDAADGVDASVPDGDGASAPVDAALPTYPPDPGDGTPTRIACTESLGTALTTSFGRLDGTIVSVVPPKQHKCNGDSTHIHLQVLANSETYDIAVNVDTLFAEKDGPLLNEPWAEGWHTTGEKLDYPSMLAIHSTDFAQPTVAALTQQLEAELANVNHVSIFGTGYGPDGAHLIHRNGGATDGAVVLHPLGATAHYLLFHFDTQTF